MDLKDLKNVSREPNSREHHKAKWWRLHHAQMTVEELAHATGYTSDAIYRFERGLNSAGEPHSERSWKRYKYACRAITLARNLSWSDGDWQ